MNFRSDFFPARYTAEFVELDGASQVSYEFASNGASSRYAVVRVESIDGHMWSATFAVSPAMLHGAVRGLFPTPNDSILLVVIDGTAFIVPVNDPMRTVVLNVDGPLMDVLPARDRGVLVVTTPWVIGVIGKDGQIWSSDRISIEELKVDRVDGPVLHGTTDYGSDEPRSFTLDLSTNQIKGGSGF